MIAIASIAIKKNRSPSPARGAGATRKGVAVGLLAGDGLRAFLIGGAPPGCQFGLFRARRGAAAAPWQAAPQALASRVADASRHPRRARAPAPPVSRDGHDRDGRRDVQEPRLGVHLGRATGTRE